MKHQVVIPFAHSPMTLLRSLVNPQFHVAKWRGLGAIGCQLIEYGPTKAGFGVQLRRHAKQDAGSGLLARFVPREVTFIHRDEWDPTTLCGVIEVDLEGLPLRMRSATRIVKTATGCEQRFDWEITASIPLLGGALEALAARGIDQFIGEETRVVSALLDQYA